jgi:hypothetical protein
MSHRYLHCPCPGCQRSAISWWLTELGLLWKRLVLSLEVVIFSPSRAFDFPAIQKNTGIWPILFIMVINDLCNLLKVFMSVNECLITNKIQIKFRYAENFVVLLLFLKWTSTYLQKSTSSRYLHYDNSFYWYSSQVFVLWCSADSNRNLLGTIPEANDFLSSILDFQGAVA